MRTSKKIVCLILIILLLSSGCSEKTSAKASTKTEQEILALANNEKPKEYLITKKIFPVYSFSDNDIGNYGVSYGSTIEEVNRVCEIECLRHVGEYYYAIFRPLNGGWLYLLFSYSVEEQKYIVADAWYFKKPVYKADFEKLKVNESTLQDFMKIDPFAGKALHTSGINPFSCDYTYDEYDVVAEYRIRGTEEELTPKDYYICNLTIEPLTENTVPYNLLPMDKPKGELAVGMIIILALVLPAMIGGVLSLIYRRKSGKRVFIFLCGKRKSTRIRTEG